MTRSCAVLANKQSLTEAIVYQQRFGHARIARRARDLEFGAWRPEFESPVVTFAIERVHMNSSRLSSGV